VNLPEVATNFILTDVSRHNCYDAEGSVRVLAIQPVIFCCKESVLRQNNFLEFLNVAEIPIFFKRSVCFDGDFPKPIYLPNNSSDRESKYAEYT
jgi:hypothetical protein